MFRLLLTFFITIDRNPTREVMSMIGAANTRFEIDKDVIRIKIDHFSWYSPAFLRNKFVRDVTMCCQPVLPECMPRTRQLSARVYVYKMQKGMDEVMCAVEVPSNFLKRGKINVVRAIIL